MKSRIAVVVSLLLLSSVSVFAQASTFIANSRVPIDFQITSCTGEIITFLGEAHVIQQATGNPNAAHGLTHINFHLQGTGADGTLWQVNDVLNGMEVSGGGIVFQNGGRLVAVSQGSEDNLVVETTIHTTTNANGELVVERFEFEADCRG